MNGTTRPTTTTRGDDPFAKFDAEAETTYYTDYRNVTGPSDTNQNWASFPTLREQKTIQDVLTYPDLEEAMNEDTPGRGTTFREYVKAWKPPPPPP